MCLIVYCHCIYVLLPLNCCVFNYCDILYSVAFYNVDKFKTAIFTIITKLYT